jgi:hypothetical protein
VPNIESRCNQLKLGHPPTSVNTSCKGTVSISAQQELINANYYLLLISEPELGFF